MQNSSDQWQQRARRFWNERQRRSHSGALTGYLLDESPACIGARRFQGEWDQAFGWLAPFAGPKKTALDLGCGTGVWMPKLASQFKMVEGWDFAPAMIEASRRHLKKAGVKNAKLKCGQLTTRPGKAAFDFILVGGVLMYTPDATIGALLKSVSRLAKDGALILFRESTLRGKTWAREGQLLRGGLIATQKQKSDLDYVAIYRSREALSTLFESAGLNVTRIVRNRHYKFSDLTEDWLRRFDFLSGGRLSKNPELAGRVADWIFAARALLLYPEYVWRGVLGLNPWKIENFWFVCEKNH